MTTSTKRRDEKTTSSKAPYFQRDLKRRIDRLTDAAVAYGVGLETSTQDCRESSVKGKNYETALAELQKFMEQTEERCYRRYVGTIFEPNNADPY